MVSKIDWCTHTANPFHGCEHECEFCYARRFAHRLAGNPRTAYHALRQMGVDPFTPAYSRAAMKRLDDELARARKPRRVFLGSMGDLGGAWPYERVDYPGVEESPTLVQLEVRELIASHPRHTFLLLTKNPAGLLEQWPDNAHVGVSITDPSTEWHRVQVLVDQVRAGVLWASVEPLARARAYAMCAPKWGQLDWVVIGLETGPGRPKGEELEARRDCARVLTGHLMDVGVPVFVKENVFGKVSRMRQLP